MPSLPHDLMTFPPRAPGIATSHRLPPPAIAIAINLSIHPIVRPSIRFVHRRLRLRPVTGLLRPWTVGFRCTALHCAVAMAGVFVAVSTCHEYQKQIPC